MFTVGVSLALPLFLLLREIRIERRRRVASCVHPVGPRTD